jgi:hypothetical protein
MCYEDVQWRCALVGTTKLLQIMLVHELQECPEYTHKTEHRKGFVQHIQLVDVFVKPELLVFCFQRLIWPSNSCQILDVCRVNFLHTNLIFKGL